MNKKPSKGMSPVVKVGIGCCALLGLVIVGSCVAAGLWGQGLASIDGPTTTARYTATVGGNLPASVVPKFSMDMSPIPMRAVFAADSSEDTKLTLIAVEMPLQQGAPMAEHFMAWRQVVGPFAPQMQQLGVSLRTAEALLITDTGGEESLDIEVEGKTFKATVIPCKHQDGTELKRVYVKLKANGTNVVGLFGIGGADDFDDSAFEEALKGCTPR